MRKLPLRRGAAGIAAGLLLFSAAGVCADTVIVRPGDTVISIAERELGDRSRFTEICRLNRRVLGGDCDWLLVGMELELPQGPATRITAASNADLEDDAPGAGSVLTGDFVAHFVRGSGHTMTAPQGYEVAQRNNFLRLAGHSPGASAGGRPGIWIRLPESIEQAAGGNTVTVDALVRSTAPGAVELAYSTNEVGNSGWQKREIGTEFNKVSFTYEVPPMRAGNGDYVGVLPDPDNKGQVLFLADIAVTVLPE